MELSKFEKQLKEATLDPQKAIQVAGELAISYLGKAHENEDRLRVDVARAILSIKDTAQNLKMSMTEARTRVEATDLFHDYLKAKHATERIEEFIKIAKKHAQVAGGY